MKIRNALLLVLATILLSSCSGVVPVTNMDNDLGIYSETNESEKPSDEVAPQETSLQETASDVIESDTIELEEVDSEQTNEDLNPTIQKAEPIDYDAIKPYEVGQIMVIMYHDLVEGVPPSPYQRNIDDFKSDLQGFYDSGYRLLSLRDLVDNNITTEAGYTPLVLTFDDGESGSFSLVDDNGKLVPRPDCAIDILEKFYIEHPDFGKSATFYINANNDPFTGAGTMQERLTYLVDNGFDIGNHTFDHAAMTALSKDEIQFEIGAVHNFILEYLPNYKQVGVSYPYGKRPTEELRKYILEGEYNGISYHYDFALREGQSEASSTPNRKGFDVLNLPRVRGSYGENTDLGWTLELFNEYPEKRYISDGNPDMISVPKEYSENVNEESLNGKQLYLYELSE